MELQSSRSYVVQPLKRKTMINSVFRLAGRRHLSEGGSIRTLSTEKLTTGNIPVYCDIKLCVLPTINSNSSISPWKLVALYTWGVGTGGQLGHAKFPVERSVLGEDYYNQAEPRRLLKSTSYNLVAVGSTYTLAITETGHLFGWGNRFGKTQSLVPQIFPADRTYTHVSAGSKHAAAVDTDGQVYTWGDGGSWFSGGGQLGHDSYESFDEPK